MPSKSLTDRHEDLIPMGCNVSSKSRNRFCRGYGPSFITSGKGAIVVDDQGRKLLTWNCGLGSLTLGLGMAMSGRPESYDLPHLNELRLAELIKSMVPWVDMMRFMKNGSDVTSAAVRLARTYTGRERIAFFGDYSGWGDWAIDASKEGVPTCVRGLTDRYCRDLEGTDSLCIPSRHPACVILEPATLKHYSIGFLTELRSRCTQLGIVLIFDEVITGFRAAKGGIAELSGVKPDLWCAGKAMGNGWPISVIAGKREIMECFQRTHLSGTHFAEPTAMKAAIKTLKTMEKEKFWGHQNRIGSTMINGIQAAIGNDEKIRVLGNPWHFLVQFDDDVEQTYFQKLCIDRGVLFSGGHFISLAHTMQHVRTSLSVYRHALGEVRAGRAAGDVLNRLGAIPVNTTIFKRNQ